MCYILPWGIFVLGQGISTEGLKDAYVVLQRKTIYSLEDAIIDIPYLAFPLTIPFLVPLPGVHHLVYSLLLPVAPHLEQSEETLEDLYPCSGCCFFL